MLTESSVVRVSTRDGERRDVTAAGGGPQLDRPLAIGREPQPGRTLLLDRSRRLLTLDDATGDRTELAAFPNGFDSRGLANVEDTADIEGCDGRVLILHRSAEALFALGPLAPGLPVVSSQSLEFFRGSGPRLVVPGAMACVPGEGRVLVATFESLISIDLDTGDRTVVSGTRGSGPLWRVARALTVDFESEVAYVAEDESLFEVDLTFGDRRRIADGRLADGPELIDVRGLVHDHERELLFVQDGGLDAIVAVDLRTGRRVLSSR